MPRDFGISPDGHAASLEQTAMRALQAGTLSYRAIKAFGVAVEVPVPDRPDPGAHENLRASYYFGSPDTDRPAPSV